MNIHTIIQVFLVGAGFAIYPIFLTQSKLSGSITAVVFGAGVFIVSLPFAYGSYGQIQQARWPMLVPAILIVGFSVLMYVSAIVKTPIDKISTLVSLMTVSQIVTIAIADIAQNGSFSAKRAAGFILAAISSPLLIKG